MRSLSFGILLLVSAVAGAETFEERLKVAVALERMNEHYGYFRQILPIITREFHDGVRECFEKTKQPQQDTFILLADIDAQGIPRAVEVRPNTNIAACMAERTTTLRFPVPPKAPGRDAFPIYVEMNLK